MIGHVTFKSLKATENSCFPGTKEVLDVVSSFCDLKKLILCLTPSNVLSFCGTAEIGSVECPSFAALSTLK